MGGYEGWALHEFDEERDLIEPSKKGLWGCWILESKDCIPILYPFELWAHTVGSNGMKVATGWLSLPGMVELKTKDGYAYMTAAKIPGEAGKIRESAFGERMMPFLEDFGKMWNEEYKPWLQNEFLRFKNMDIEKLSDIDLASCFEEWVHYHNIGWNRHMHTHYAGAYVHGAFEELCKELLGIDEAHPTFKALMSGFGNRMFQSDKGLWRLAQSAVENGLGPIFDATPDDEALHSKLKETKEGEKWLEDLYAFLDENGWRTTRVFDFSSPSWVEKPSLAFPPIRAHMKSKGEYPLDKERERLSMEREKASAEILPRIPDERREMFEKLMSSAQAVGVYAEEHMFYCEYYWNSLARRLLKEMGSRFAEGGIIEDPLDIYFLFPQEIETRGYTVEFGAWDAKELVRIRKRQYEEFSKTEPPTFLGDPSKIGESIPQDLVLLRYISGGPISNPELKADMFGSNSTPGVAEGPARVIFSESEFDTVEPGEIVVAPYTTSLWTPLFNIAQGIVTDAGGSLSHALIIGREYGLPVVVGTLEATRKIKTGQRIRVDGDNCCIYTL